MTAGERFPRGRLSSAVVSRAPIMVLLAFSAACSGGGDPAPFAGDAGGAWTGELTYGYISGTGPLGLPVGPVVRWDAQLDLVMVDDSAFSGTILLTDEFGGVLGPLAVSGFLAAPDGPAFRLGRIEIPTCLPAGMAFEILLYEAGEMDGDLESPTWPCNDAGEGLPAFGALAVHRG